MSRIYDLGLDIAWLVHQRHVPKKKVLEILRPRGALYIQVLKVKKVSIPGKPGKFFAQRTDEIDEEATERTIAEHYTDEWLSEQIDYVLKHPNLFRQIAPWKSHKWRKERGLDEY